MRVKVRFKKKKKHLSAESAGVYPAVALSHTLQSGVRGFCGIQECVSTQMMATTGNQKQSGYQSL